MLAQSFLTADDLSLPSEEHRQALIKTLVLLETGKLQHVDEWPAVFLQANDGDVGPFTGHFNMALWRGKVECRTIACLGGTAELVGNVSFDNMVLPYELKELFMPRLVRSLDWGRITTAQAATALRSYLANGKARWDLAVKVA